MRPPLVLALPLIEGETLSGYVSRSAQLFRTTPRDWCSDLGMRWPFLCSGHDDQLDRLAWLIGVPVERLQAWRTRKRSIGTYQVGRAVATTGVLRRTSVRLCPRCVCEALDTHGPSGIYQMVEWSICSLHVCFEHGCPLITLEPGADTHSTYDFAGRVLQQVDAVRAANTGEERCDPTVFETYCRDRIWNGPADDWLSDLDLTQLHRASLNLGAALQGLKTSDLQAMTMQDHRHLCDTGWSALQNGSNGYLNALRLLRRQSKSERPYYSADLGPLCDWLRGVAAAPELQHVLDLTCEHIFATYPTPLDRDVFGRRPTQETWLTIQEARKRTGCGGVYLKRLLGYLDGVSAQEAMKRSDVHVDEIAKVNDFRASHINLKDAAHRLGILTVQVKALLNRNVLDTVKINSALRYLKRAQVDALVHDVGALAQAPVGLSALPLKDFCRDKRIGIAAVIALWQRGKMEGSVYRGDGHGLQAIEIAWDALVDADPPTLEGDLMLPDVARHLKIGIKSVRSLRDHGLLRQIHKRNPDTNHMKSYITRGSLVAFEATYVTLGQIAQAQKAASIHIARRLDREGVQTVSCGPEMVRVYHRTYVEDLVGG